MTIQFIGGAQQVLRYRTRDLTFQGHVDAAFPLAGARWQLNDGAARDLYVEAIADPGIDWTVAYKASPAELRCKDLGDFTVELPVTDPALRAGDNRLTVEITDTDGARESAEVAFTYDPTPVPLPLDLSDLGGFESIQEIGQLVAGGFELDRAANVIRSRVPAYPDSMLVIGGVHGSQEATYDVRFVDMTGTKWLGPSDFFVGFEDKDPPIGIKTGWSSAGMMALNPRGEARCFIAWGDHSETEREWVVVTDPPRPVAIEQGVLYSVRHQVTFTGGLDRCRFRIWPKGEPEPDDWLCAESDATAPAHLARHGAASFGLFQHSGGAIDWSNIRLHAL